MQLNTYLRENKLTDEKFGQLLGDVAPRRIRNWRYRARLPDAAMMVRIAEITAGSVTLADWAIARTLPPVSEEQTGVAA